MENGRELTIARYTTGTPAGATQQQNAANYSFVCGARSRSFDMSAEEIDRTIPNCLDPSQPVVASSKPGRQRRQFKCSGIMILNAQGKAMLDDARLARLNYYNISVPGYGDFSGLYSVSTSLAGEMEDDMTYDATFTLADASTELFEADV